jgi:hypothetical protein
MHIYARPEIARRAIHGLNSFWIRWVGLSRPAYHNIFIFKKEFPAGVSYAGDAAVSAHT